MHPYRRPAPSTPSADPAPVAGSACKRRVDDFIGAMLLAVGSLVGIAGMVSADGTLIAVGTAVALPALLRANATYMNGTHPEGAGREREHAMDAVYIGLMMFLFAATLGLIRLCERV